MEMEVEEDETMEVEEEEEEWVRMGLWMQWLTAWGFIISIHQLVSAILCLVAASTPRIVYYPCSTIFSMVMRGLAAGIALSLADFGNEKENFIQTCI